MWNAVQASDIASAMPERSVIIPLLLEKDDEVEAESPRTLKRDVIAEGFRRAATQLKLVDDGKITQKQLDEAAVKYGRSIGSYPAFPDTVEAAQRLSKHYKLIPLTNVDNWSFEGTLANGLKGVIFDAIYTAEDIGSYKPDLRNFKYLEEHLKQDFGLTRDQLCHTAESLSHDHRSAKDYGLPYHVWVDRQNLFESVQDYVSYDINLKVNTLAELADIVDAAFQR